MCGNIPSCSDPLNDRGNRTIQLHWLKLLHALYIFLLSQAGKDRVFYSVDKCFESGACPCNILDTGKQILKVSTACLSAFYCVISRATLAWSLNACAIARFSKSARADNKLQGATLSGTHLSKIRGSTPPRQQLTKSHVNESGNAFNTTLKVYPPTINKTNRGVDVLKINQKAC